MHCKSNLIANYIWLDTLWIVKKHKFNYIETGKADKVTDLHICIIIYPNEFC